jgi:hypothetical protein
MLKITLGIIIVIAIIGYLIAKHKDKSVTFSIPEGSTVSGGQTISISWNDGRQGSQVISNNPNKIGSTAATGILIEGRYKLEILDTHKHVINTIAVTKTGEHREAGILMQDFTVTLDKALLPKGPGYIGLQIGMGFLVGSPLPVTFDGSSDVRASFFSSFRDIFILLGILFVMIGLPLLYYVAKSYLFPSTETSSTEPDTSFYGIRDISVNEVDSEAK